MIPTFEKDKVEAGLAENGLGRSALVVMASHQLWAGVARWAAARWLWAGVGQVLLPAVELVDHNWSFAVQCLWALAQLLRAEPMGTRKGKVWWFVPAARGFLHVNCGLSVV